MVFKSIWDNHRDHLLNFIKTKVKDEVIAEDILQEVSLKLYNNLYAKNDITNHKKWLFQVTRNTIADHYRKSEAYIELKKKSFESNSNSDPCVCDVFGFIIKQYLPETYSTPLYLSDIEQKSQQEIADLLELSLTATKSRIQRGRKKLKELISDWVILAYNHRGQIVDFKLKNEVHLPKELKDELEKINLLL